MEIVRHKSETKLGLGPKTVAALPEKVPGGAFGMFILAAIHRLQDQAYGANIARHLKAHGRNAPTPRVYQTLALLEAQGLLESTVTETTDGARVRGKPARVYRLSAPSLSVISFFSLDTQVSS
jgi:hypothetical protein